MTGDAIPADPVTAAITEMAGGSIDQINAERLVRLARYLLGEEPAFGMRLAMIT